MTRHGSRLVVTSKYPVIAEGAIIYLRCPKCRTKKPLASFGLRKMADGTLRNQPDCSDCRSRESRQRVKRNKSVLRAVKEKVVALTH